MKRAFLKSLFYVPIVGWVMLALILYEVMDIDYEPNMDIFTIVQAIPIGIGLSFLLIH